MFLVSFSLWRCTSGSPRKKRW